jgi:hypothetical protein
MEEYFIIVRIKIKENVMKTTYFENVRNREKFFCKNLKDIQMIDGIEYLKVFRFDTKRECLVKKESLRKIAEPK